MRESKPNDFQELMLDFLNELGQRLDARRMIWEAREILNGGAWYIKHKAYPLARDEISLVVGKYLDRALEVMQ